MHHYHNACSPKNNKEPVPGRIDIGQEPDQEYDSDKKFADKSLQNILKTDA